MLAMRSILLRGVHGLLLIVFTCHTGHAGFSVSPLFQDSVRYYDSVGSASAANPQSDPLTFPSVIGTADIDFASSAYSQVLPRRYAVPHGAENARRSTAGQASGRTIDGGDERLARALLKDIGESVVRVGLKQEVVAGDFVSSRHWNEGVIAEHRVARVPEPSIVALLATGLLALILSRRRARR